MGVGGLHHDGTKRRISSDPAHRAGIGHKQHVVLVLAKHGSSLGRQQTDNDKRSSLDPDNLADGIGVAEESRGCGLADEGDFIPAANVILSEIRAAGQRPGANLQVGIAHAHHLRIDILVAGGKLREIAHFRAGAGDSADLLSNRVIILARERARCAEPRDLEPRGSLLATRAAICAFAPLPMATMAMTAPTPMIIPSMVSSVRSVLRRSARMAILSVARRSIQSPA